MAIALDTTVGGANANAFVDVDYVAEMAAVSGPIGAAWLVLDEDAQIGTILRATRLVSARQYIGDRTSDAQRLSFPRTGLVYYDDDVIPSIVEEATAIEAIASTPLFAAGGSAFPTPATQTLQLKRKKTGPLEREWFAPGVVDATSTQSLTADVQLLLAELLSDVSADQYGASIQRRTS